MLGLRFVRGLSLVAASGGHSSSRCAGLSLLRPLLLRSTGSGRTGSAVVAHGPSCSAACGIFPDQGSNPCPLHWQADSQPLHHQGSPTLKFEYRRCSTEPHFTKLYYDFSILKFFCTFLKRRDIAWHNMNHLGKLYCIWFLSHFGGCYSNTTWVPWVQNSWNMLLEQRWVSDRLNSS